MEDGLEKIEFPTSPYRLHSPSFSCAKLPPVPSPPPRLRETMGSVNEDGAWFDSTYLRRILFHLSPFSEFPELSVEWKALYFRDKVSFCFAADYNMEREPEVDPMITFLG